MAENSYNAVLDGKNKPSNNILRYAWWGSVAGTNIRTFKFANT